MKYKTTDITPFIYAALQDAILELTENKVSQLSDIKKLCDNLTDMASRMQLYGITQGNGVDSELRPAYVIMQCIIETALTDAIKKGVCETATAHIITPRMPTPLMLPMGKSLSEIDVSNPLALAQYRHNVLLNFLKANGKITAIYCHDAQTALSSTDSDGLASYHRCVERFSNLEDRPDIKMDMKSLPQQYTGAIYHINGAPITVQSAQVTQIDNANPSIWAIKFAENALERVAQVKGFLEERGVGVSF